MNSKESEENHRERREKRALTSIIIQALKFKQTKGGKNEINPLHIQKKYF